MSIVLFGGLQSPRPADGVITLNTRRIDDPELFLSFLRQENPRFALFDVSMGITMEQIRDEYGYNGPVCVVMDEMDPQWYHYGADHILVRPYDDEHLLGVVVMLERRKQFWASLICDYPIPADEKGKRRLTIEGRYAYYIYEDGSKVNAYMCYPDIILTRALIENQGKWLRRSDLAALVNSTEGYMNVRFTRLRRHFGDNLINQRPLRPTGASWEYRLAAEDTLDKNL